MANCLQCQSPAFVHAEWKAAGNYQEGDFCQSCMAEVWRMFGRSTVFTYVPVKD